MIGRSFRVASILGIPLKIDLSWGLIVVLLTSSLALGYSREYPHLPWPTLVLMGLGFSLLLFGSVLAHELAHSVVAIRHGMTIRGITLFIFGGAAELSDEPPNARAELMVALAGPAMSLVLAFLFAGFHTLGLGWLPTPLVGVAWDLATMNTILVAFNIVPGFPLDGGRVLRAMLWSLWEDLHRSTRVAAAVGSGFGGLIILLGLVYALSPFRDFLGSIWYIFIGVFLRNAARLSYRQLLLRDSLRGIKAADLMTPEVVSVSMDTTLEHIVNRLVLTSGRTEFPVLDGSKLLGVVGLGQIQAMDRSTWARTTAGEVMRRDLSRNIVSVADDATRALQLASNEESVLLVVDGDTVVGTVTPRELVKRLRLRRELGGNLKSN